MDEFTLIRSHLAPLSKKMAGSFRLSDDAASWMPPKGEQAIISTDGYVENVHFRASDPPQAIGEKILRAALSDIAAMGAKPQCWFLTAAFGRHLRGDKIKHFVSGCRKAQTKYGITLAGGDVIAKSGGSVFSVTVIGSARKILRRSGARQGDRLYVTGTLGDAALGLRFPDEPFLAKRYLYPEPRLALARYLPDLASAAIDLSDGLLADLAHLCRASTVGASTVGALIHADKLPISPAAKRKARAPIRLALNAGDDYELLIAAPPAREARLFAAAARARTPLAHIGEIRAHGQIIARDAHGNIVKPLRQGFRHFL